MAKYKVEGETIEEIREELNIILKRLYRDIQNLSGFSGDIAQEGRIVTLEDIVFDKITKGPVVRDSGGGYWRLYADTSGTPLGESVKFTQRD